MNIIDVLNQIWTQILEITAIFLMPDWTFVVIVSCRSSSCSAWSARS